MKRDMMMTKKTATTSTAMTPMAMATMMMMLATSMRATSAGESFEIDQLRSPDVQYSLPTVAPDRAASPLGCLYWPSARLVTKARAMTSPADLDATLLASWRTNSRVTAYLVEHLPAALWNAAVPGAPRRTIRMIAGHIHNARCMWLKTLGHEHGIAVPAAVNRRKVTRR